MKCVLRGPVRIEIKSIARARERASSSAAGMHRLSWESLAIDMKEC